MFIIFEPLLLTIYGSLSFAILAYPSWTSIDCYDIEDSPES